MHRIITTTPLRFQNPYFTSGFKKVFNFSYRSPIYNGNISQGEAALQQQIIEKLQKMKNEGLIRKNGDTNGDTNHDGKIDMETLSKMGINSMVMPEGVANVREAEKERDVARQIERFNADILSAKQEKFKSQLKALERRQKAERTKKLIKFLAESEDIEEIPAEFQEAVKDYYKGKDIASDDEDKDEEMARRKKMKKKVEKLRKKNIAKREEEESKAYHPYGARPVQKYTTPGEVGYGMVPRINHLVQPFFSLDSQLNETPAQIAEREKNDLDERRKLFKDYQILQRGKEPSKEMVSRAMPETATPMKVDEPPSKKIDIIPHPFVYKINKFPIVKLRR